MLTNRSLLILVLGCVLASELGCGEPSGDQAFLQCETAVADDYAKVVEEIVLSIATAPCVGGADWSSRVERLIARLAACPDPDDMHLRLARRYFSRALNEALAGIEANEESCPIGDPYWIDESTRHFARANDLLDDCVGEIQQYRASD